MLDRALPPCQTEDAIEFVDLIAQRRRLGERLDQAVARVLEHAQFVMGPEVAELEGRLSNFCGARHAIACSSGTDALLLLLTATEVSPNDAVFIPSFTFAATAEAVVLAGAIPIFVDVDASTFNLDPGSLIQAVEWIRSSDLKPAGLVAVDLFGQPADYARLADVCRRYDMWFLADAAQSFGSTYEGRRTGTIAKATATSFFPSKPLGCYGDGGAIFTDDDELAELIRSLRIHGQGRDKYSNVRIGFNARLDTIQAAILLEKLTIFEDELDARRRIASRYEELLSGMVRVPTTAPNVESSWALYTIKVRHRQRVRESLRLRDVPSAIYYPSPLHMQPAYRNFPRVPSGLPVSEALSGQVLSLPIHPYLTHEEQDSVVVAISDGLSGATDA